MINEIFHFSGEHLKVYKLISMYWFSFITHNMRRMIGVSGSLTRSKTLMELIFNLFGGFRLSPEGPVSQIHSPHLHVGAPGIISDLLRSVQLLKRRGVSCGKQREAIAPIQSLVKLQPRFLRLQWRTCPWAEHSADEHGNKQFLTRFDFSIM